MSFPENYETPLANEKIKKSDSEIANPGHHSGSILDQHQTQLLIFVENCLSFFTILGWKLKKNPESQLKSNLESFLKPCIANSQCLSSDIKNDVAAILKFLQTAQTNLKSDKKPSENFGFNNQSTVTGLRLLFFYMAERMGLGIFKDMMPASTQKALGVQNIEPPQCANPATHTLCTLMLYHQLHAPALQSSSLQQGNQAQQDQHMKFDAFETQINQFLGATFKNYTDAEQNFLRYRFLHQWSLAHYDGDIQKKSPWQIIRIIQGIIGPSNFLLGFYTVVIFTCNYVPTLKILMGEAIDWIFYDLPQHEIILSIKHEYFKVFLYLIGFLLFLIYKSMGRMLSCRCPLSHQDNLKLTIKRFHYAIFSNNPSQFTDYLAHCTTVLNDPPPKWKAILIIMLGCGISTPFALLACYGCTGKLFHASIFFMSFFLSLCAYQMGVYRLKRKKTGKDEEHSVGFFILCALCLTAPLVYLTYANRPCSDMWTLCGIGIILMASFYVMLYVVWQTCRELNFFFNLEKNMSTQQKGKQTELEKQILQLTPKMSKIFWKLCAAYQLYKRRMELEKKQQEDCQQNFQKEPEMQDFLIFSSGKLWFWSFLILMALLFIVGFFLYDREKIDPIDLIALYYQNIVDYCEYSLFGHGHAIAILLTVITLGLITGVLFLVAKALFVHEMKNAFDCINQPSGDTVKKMHKKEGLYMRFFEFKATALYPIPTSLAYDDQKK